MAEVNALGNGCLRLLHFGSSRLLFDSLPEGRSSVSVPRTGGTATCTVTITRTNGFSAPVTFTISGLPSGATPTFTPNPASGNTSTLKITVSGSTRWGTYPFTVTGQGGTPTLTRTANATLVKRLFF